MKISLVVASGVHQGKVIAVPGAQFVIGRDEGCHLRPASPAISKKHCGLYVRDGKAFVKDLGSTNGTTVNDDPVTAERELKDGDRLKVGPLDFTVTLAAGPKTDSTPLPDALKAVAPPAAGAKPAAAGGSKPGLAPVARPTPAPTPKPPAPAKAGGDDHDEAAAMLLGMGDDDPPGGPEVPGGSTIMDMPAVDAAGPQSAKPDDKKKAATPSAAESSAAANEILRRYMRRPR